MMRDFRIAVLPGDGIGQEVMAPCLTLLEAVTSATGVRLRLDSYEAGAELYRRTGVALPAEVLHAAASADAVLLGAMGHPDIRYPNGTEVVPQIDLRDHFELYAGLRPIRALPGVRTTLADARARDIDFVVVRESTEGLFAARNESRRDGDAAVFDTMRITPTRLRTPVRVGVRARPWSPPAQAWECESHMRRQGQRAAFDGLLPRNFSGVRLSLIPTSPRTASTSTPQRCGSSKRHGISTSSSPRTCSGTSCRISVPA